MRSSHKPSLTSVSPAFFFAKIVSFLVVLYFVICAMQYARSPDFVTSLQGLMGVPEVTGSELKWCDESGSSRLSWEGHGQLTFSSEKILFQPLEGASHYLAMDPLWQKQFCRVTMEGYPSDQRPEDFAVVFTVESTTPDGAKPNKKTLEKSLSKDIYRFDDLLFRSKNLDRSLEELRAATKAAEKNRDS